MVVTSVFMSESLNHIIHSPDSDTPLRIIQEHSMLENLTVAVSLFGIIFIGDIMMLTEDYNINYNIKAV